MNNDFLKIKNEAKNIEEREKEFNFQLHKMKLHPFDFNGEDFAEIKKISPEFKPKRSQKARTSTKVNGLPIEDLKKKLK